MRWPRMGWPRSGRGSGTPGAARPPRGRKGGLRRTLLVWGVLSAVLAGALVFLFYFSAAFVVKDIKVEGAEGEVAETVVELARVPHGRPLARVSESRVQERVLTDVRIADLSLRRDWPSTVTYEVSLREPALAMQQGKRFWLSDASGVVYRDTGKAPKGVPVVRVEEPPAELASSTVQGLLDLWSTRPKNKVLEGKLSTPVLAGDGTVSMNVEQLSIVWGAPVEAEKKWAVITALVAQDAIDPEGGVPQTIDVSLPDQPIVTGLPPATTG